MKKLSNIEAELKKSVVYKKSIYFLLTTQCSTALTAADSQHRKSFRVHDWRYCWDDEYLKKSHIVYMDRNDFSDVNSLGTRMVFSRIIIRKDKIHIEKIRINSNTSFRNYWKTKKKKRFQWKNNVNEQYLGFQKLHLNRKLTLLEEFNNSYLFKVDP